MTLYRSKNQLIVVSEVEQQAVFHYSPTVHFDVIFVYMLTTQTFKTHL